MIVLMYVFDIKYPLPLFPIRNFRLHTYPNYIPTAKIKLHSEEYLKKILILVFWGKSLNHFYTYHKKRMSGKIQNSSKNQSKKNNCTSRVSFHNTLSYSLRFVINTVYEQNQRKILHSSFHLVSLVLDYRSSNQIT